MTYIANKDSLVLENIKCAVGFTFEWKENQSGKRTLWVTFDLIPGQ